MRGRPLPPYEAVCPRHGSTHARHAIGSSSYSPRVRERKRTLMHRSAADCYDALLRSATRGCEIRGHVPIGLRDDDLIAVGAAIPPGAKSFHVCCLPAVL